MVEEGAAYGLVHLYTQMRTLRFFREVFPIHQWLLLVLRPSTVKPSSYETGFMPAWPFLPCSQARMFSWVLCSNSGLTPPVILARCAGVMTGSQAEQWSCLLLLQAGCSARVSVPSLAHAQLHRQWEDNQAMGRGSTLLSGQRHSYRLSASPTARSSRLKWCQLSLGNKV